MTKVDKPRKTITYEMLNELERMAHLIRSIERYSYVRQWLSGRVLDCGCGTGYGSYMIAQNPDVECITGIDSDKTTIEFAKKEYRDDKLVFLCNEVSSYTGLNYDWLIAVEVIEHLKHPGQVAQLADRIGAKQILLTYPSKKTTHYNLFHIKNYNNEMIADLFPNFHIHKTYDFHATHDTKILFLERIEK